MHRGKKSISPESERNGKKERKERKNIGLKEVPRETDIVRKNNNKGSKLGEKKGGGGGGGKNKIK